VKNLIVNIFQQLQQLFPVHYTEEEQALIGAPTPEQISVLLSAMLLKRPDSFSKSLDEEAPPASENNAEESQEKQTPATDSNVAVSATTVEEKADGENQKE